MKNEKKTSPNYCSIAQFASKHNTARSTVNGWINEGYIQTVQLGRNRFIDMDVYGEFNPSVIQKGSPLKERGMEMKLRALDKKVDAIRESLLKLMKE